MCGTREGHLWLLHSTVLCSSSCDQNDPSLVVCHFGWLLSKVTLILQQRAKNEGGNAWFQWRLKKLHLLFSSPAECFCMSKNSHRWPWTFLLAESVVHEHFHMATLHNYCLLVFMLTLENQHWITGVNCMRGQNLGNKKHWFVLCSTYWVSAWRFMLKITSALDMACRGQCNRFHNKIGFCEPWGFFISHKGDSKEAIPLKYVDLMASVMSVWIIRAILALMAMWKWEGGSWKQWCYVN